MKHLRSQLVLAHEVQERELDEIELHVTAHEVDGLTKGFDRFSVDFPDCVDLSHAAGVVGWRDTADRETLDFFDIVGLAGRCLRRVAARMRLDVLGHIETVELQAPASDFCSRTRCQSSFCGSVLPRGDSED